MKILHIISSGGMYGAEAVILNMSRTLNESSHSSVLGVFSNSANPNLQLHGTATAQGIESHLISCTGQIDRTVPSSIRELADRTNADVVHAHGYKADIYCYFALRGSRVPLVSTCHTWYDNDLTVSLYGAADRFILRNYAAIVAVSEDVKQRLLKAGVRKEKIHIVRNGIDLRPFDNAAPSLRNLSSQDAPIVGLIGRLATEKGVDIFLRAAARVLAELPATKFVVIGEGPDREQLEILIDELQVRNNVFMLGRRDDMPGVYASLDIMVSASRHEGLPMAILEGMASSRPVVATAVGAVPEAVLDGRTGVLVPSENVEALAAKIVALLNNRTQRENLGAAAKRLIEEEFSAERMTTDYLHIYEQAIATKKQRVSTHSVSSAISQGKTK
ncbi:glycosyltransferase family 4 protein [Tunturiibacter gelidoferens]|uniref:Glycosyltransferase involved in cell wall biosynthesis n=1 Tax=Tunturiibacter gelidiferens TaxID=3069689 RepID=A0A9X0U4N7_9BACT|nr:glycosyltransferase family 4 protein [Edaphobacter lichenicola]MBB5329661.1 glycosyltransferase involved in cell wall biosynthesis [Edaphobacter lichenicola]